MEMIGNAIVAQHGFQHKWQLRQLRNLDKPAYAKATLLVKYGLFTMSAKIIRAAMHNALSQLTSPHHSNPPSFKAITQIIENKKQWHSGEVIDLWLSGSTSLHIRNESFSLNVLIVTEGACLMDRVTVTLQIGWLDPLQGRWEIDHTAQHDYDKHIKNFNSN